VQLARALAQVARPAINQINQINQQNLPAAVRWLLLDEPTAALDLQHQHHVLAAVQRWAATPSTGAVAVLHDLNLALRYCSHCVLLDAGRVVASGPSAEVLTPEQIQALWGVRANPLWLAAPENSPKEAKKVLQYLFEPLTSSPWKSPKRLARGFLHPEGHIRPRL